MKKNNIIVYSLLTLAMIAASCNKDDRFVAVEDSASFTGSIAKFGTETRTTLDANDNVFWTNGDKVSINGQTYTAHDSDEEVTKFKYDESEATKVDGKFYAYYPAAIYNNGTPALQATQTYESGHISNAPMYAESSNVYLDFQNICALIELNLRGIATVGKIEVTSAENALWGSFSVTGNAAVVSDTPDNLNKTVTLECRTGVTLNEVTGEKFWIAIPQGVHDLSFKVTTKLGDRVFEESIGYKVSFAANHIYYADWTLEFFPEGGISGKFTINSNGDQICFSKGNLQYQASSDTWRFAENQWDAIGNAAGNTTVSADQSDWIDLFGWGTSGYNGKYPYMTSKTDADYGNGDNHITGTEYDWGLHNAISNGGNVAGMWRTLASAEWTYLISTRKVKGATGEGNSYKRCTINGVYGVLFFHDDYKGITDSSTYPNIPEGCVFLPISQLRNGTAMTVDDTAYYWSTTASDASNASAMRFKNGTALGIAQYARHDGFAVRLVQNVRNSGITLMTVDTETNLDE